MQYREAITTGINTHCVLYVALIVSAFWFGWRGGVASAALISMAYFPQKSN